MTCCQQSYFHSRLPLSYEGPKPIMTTQRMQSHNSNYQVHRIFNKSGLLALYPGSTELSIASSTVKWAGPGYEVTGLSKLPLS